MGAPSFSILGSCVSRDLLALDERGRLELRVYVARHAVLSALAPPVPIDPAAIRLDSEFQRRMVVNDLRKTAFELLAARRSDFLLVDLVDERHGVIAWRGSVITLSNELLDSGLVRGARGLRRIAQLRAILGVGRRPGPAELREWCGRIRALYPPDRVVVHRAYLMEEYVARDGAVRPFPPAVRRFNRAFNRIAEAMYDGIAAALPGCHAIDECRGGRAWAGHRWGLSPPHYPDEYYRRAVDRILARIG